MLRENNKHSIKLTDIISNKDCNLFWLTGETPALAYVEMFERLESECNFNFDQDEKAFKTLSKYYKWREDAEKKLKEEFSKISSASFTINDENGV